MTRTFDSRVASSPKGALLKRVLCVLAIASAGTAIADEPSLRQPLLHSANAPNAAPELHADVPLHATASTAVTDDASVPLSAGASGDSSQAAPIMLAVYEVAPVPPENPPPPPPPWPPVGPPPPPPPRMCVAGDARVIGERRLSVMLDKLSQFIDAVKAGENVVTGFLQLGTPMKWTPYGDIRPMFKVEDLAVPCCVRPADPAPTIFPVTRYSGNVIGEKGLLAQQKIGLKLVLSSFPLTKPIENISGIGEKLDNYFAKNGAGCYFRAFAEASFTGGGSYYSGAAPCLKCSISVHASGTILGGGGVQCSAGEGPLVKGVHLVQASIQGWAKLSPIGYQEDCVKGKLLMPGLSGCVQVRVRYYDWLDIERQACSDVMHPFGA